MPFFQPKNFALLGPDQLLKITSDFVFTDHETISDWTTM